MSISFQGTKNGEPRTGTLNYSVVYENSTTFMVNFTHTLNGKGNAGTLWILKNGTVLAVERGGKNYTGSTASNFVLSHFSDLDILYSFATQESTVTSYFHSNGTSTANIGTNSFTVTDYVANTTPETVQVCNEGTAVLDTYNVYLGAPTGSSLEMVTSANFSGTLTSSSGTIITLDLSYHLTALTVS
jgi:hypothetical protein